MKPKVFITSFGETIYMPTKFSIGDIVTIDNFGYCYSSFKQAFDCMNGDSFHFSNVINSPYGLTICPYGIFKSNRKPFHMNVGHDYFRKNVNWKIVDICLHNNGRRVLYLLASAIDRLGILIDECALELKHRSLDEIEKIYFVVN